MTSYAFASNRYDTMPYRRCGKSGLKLPVLSLGFWQVLGEAGYEDVCRQCCYHAFDHGVTHFDLANNYGVPSGHSERVVGNILRDMPRDELIVSTKAGHFMWPGPYGDWGSRKSLIASLDQSLQRLGLDYVDIFYHHRPDPETPPAETLGALDQIVRQGKALYVGVSKYNGQEFLKALETVNAGRLSPLTIHQARYSMLGRAIETDLLPVTHQAGTGVIAFSCLAGGMLSDRYLHGLPADSRRGKTPDAKQWYDKHQAAGMWKWIAALNAIAQARGQTLAQMAVTWVLRDERIASVLTGVSRLEQLKDTLAAVTAPPLSAEELRQIEAILAS